MKIYFSGVGEANGVNVVADMEVCPRLGEEVAFGNEEWEGHATWYVRHIQHQVKIGPNPVPYDVYCVVGKYSR